MRDNDNKQTVELVSIVLPILNPNPDMFRSAIDSLLNQTYKHIEVIIVEAPGDVTGEEIVKSYSDPRIRYILNPTISSLRDQLNQGISESRGDYIARMDGDDISCPDRIQKQLKFLNDNEEFSLVGSCLELIDDSSKSLGYRHLPENHQDIVNGLSVYCTIAHPSIMFRKNDIIDMGCYQDSAPMEDWDLWCRMALAGKKFYNIQEPLLKYRIHTQAGKVKSLRKTLKTGVELKKRHFKGIPGRWGIREEARCLMEQLFMLLPPQLVVKMFLAISLRKRF